MSPINRLLAIAAAAAWLCSAAFAVERVAPESPIPWQVDKHPFAAKRANEAFSGFACATSGMMCAAPSMKADRAPSCAIKGERLVYVGEPFEFAGVEKELDAEGAAVDGDYFLRGRIARRKARNMLRQSLTADESTGLRPTRTAILGTMAHSERLWDAMRSLPELASYAFPATAARKRPPGRNRVDIEGMAAANGRLFFALRAPNVNGKRLHRRRRRQGLFSKAAILDPLSHTVRLGANKGFRDLAIADGDALALVGPSDDEQASGLFDLRVARTDDRRSVQAKRARSARSCTMRR